MIVHVSVTAEDIENGIRRDCWKCPVAIAMFRATGVKYVVRGISAAVVGSPDDLIALPERVINFIQRYDDGKFPRPMEFDLEIDVPTVADVVRD
jgi:hypothetical protein